MYYIDDTNPAAVKVSFYGKSMTGTVLEKYSSEIFDKHINNDYGILMFKRLGEITGNEVVGR